MGKIIRDKVNRTKNKNSNTIWIIMIVVGVILCVINIVFSCLFRGADGANIFTAISGWISGVSTLIVGLITYRQSKKYKNDAEEKERFVDLVVESVKIVDHLLPANVIGRKCVPKDSTLYGRNRFLITLFAYQDNPIFDVSVEKTVKDGSILVQYDLIQPMQKGDYGRTFLSKNEFMQLTAEIPTQDNLCGQYTLFLRFKNHYGDIFQKEIYVRLRTDFIGKIAKVTQGKTILIAKEQNNG